MKIVREYINEAFSEESDPIEDMGIGMVNNLIDKLDKIQGNHFVDTVAFIDDNLEINAYCPDEQTKNNFIEYVLLLGNDMFRKKNKNYKSDI